MEAILQHNYAYSSDSGVIQEYLQGSIYFKQLLLQIWWEPPPAPTSDISNIHISRFGTLNMLTEYAYVPLEQFMKAEIWEFLSENGFLSS